VKALNSQPNIGGMSQSDSKPKPKVKSIQRKIGLLVKEFKRKPVVFRGSRYQAGKTYFMLLTPVILERTVEARGRERKELYFIGRLEEFDKPKDAFEKLEELYAGNEPNRDLIKVIMAQEPSAIFIPRSIISQLVAQITPEAEEALENGKILLALVVQVGQAKRGQRLVRNYNLGDQRFIFLEHSFMEEIGTRGYTLYHPEAIEAIHNVLETAERILGIGNGGDEDDE